ncbi:MAG: DUF3667 domain-containing protein [Bacteroidota bacterium]
MECKNCGHNLRTDYRYCPDCGAKVIRNRITFKNLWYDVLERYFNLDNTFVKTFIHLFTQPETVINDYISGIRRKYLNPISYLGIALTLSGFIAFLMTKLSDKLNFDVFNTGNAGQSSEKIMDYTFDFQSLIFIFYIPIMAAASWLNFQKKQYNFSERVVVFMYTLAHYSLFIFIPSIVILFSKPELYAKFALLTVVSMYVYTTYVIKKISKDTGIEFIARALLFCAVFTLLYLATSLVIPLLLLLTGEISLHDFAPTKGGT